MIRPHRRRARLVKLLVVVVILAGLLELADVITRHVAEDSLATHARGATNATSASASIGGWPFLFNLVARQSVPGVTVDLTDVPVGTLHVQQVRVELTDVKIDLGAAASARNVRVTSVSRAVVTAVVTADELSAAAGHSIRLPGNGVVVATAGGHQVAARVMLLSGNVLSITSGGRSLLQVDLATNPFIKGCTMHLAVLAAEVRSSCTMAPVPKNVIDAVAGGDY